MKPTLTLYQSNSSPNSRRIRMFLAEKDVSILTVHVDLSKGEQHLDSYRAINPRRVVPTLVLEDDSAIGEVPAIQLYIEQLFPEPPLLGTSAIEKAFVAMWDRRVEQEGFASVMEAIRNEAAGLKGRAIAGPHDYDQIPPLAVRSRQRFGHFVEELEAQLQANEYVAGSRFSVADITALSTIDFARKALDFSLPASSVSTTRWYEKISQRPSAKA